MANDIEKRPSHVLEDPSAKAIARVYAVAFLDAVASSGEKDALEELTSFWDDVLKPNPEAQRVLTSEITSRDDKLGIIERAVAPRASEVLTNFLRVLARHDRLDLLPAILSEAWKEHERRDNKRRVTIKSAVELTPKQLKQIQSRLEAALPYTPVLQPVHDASMVGGLVVQVGDTVFDGSLRTRLKNLQDRLRERYLHEIQSGRDRFSSPEGN
jgi:F-type H+-transporting ATPase subunit delta